MITFTESAVKRIEHICQKENKHFRISIAGTGCNGLTYKFDMDKSSQDDDYKFEFHQAIVLVDPISMKMIKGSLVDFQTSVWNQKFVINNPNVDNQCGCGNSFSVKQNDD